MVWPTPMSLWLRLALGASALFQGSIVWRCERWILSMSGLALYSYRFAIALMAQAHLVTVLLSQLLLLAKK